MKFEEPLRTQPGEISRSPMSRRAAAILALAAITALFFAIRAPFLFGRGMFLGWNSDAGIFGLMAKKIVDGRGFDVYFWGQTYMGPLTSVVAAMFGFIRSLFGLYPPVGPVALRLATCATTLAGIYFYWSALRRSDFPAATLTGMLLALGPAIVYQSSLRATGPDMVFLLGGVIVWFASRFDLARTRPRLLFGFLCALSWWMNQGTFFFMLGVFAWIVAQTEWWSRLNLLDRALYRDQSRLTRRLVQALDLMIAAILLYLVMRDLLSWRTAVPGFRWPFAEPVAILLLVHGLPILRAVNFRRVARFLWPFAAGFLVGYAPILFGRILHWYPRRHTFGVRFSHPIEVADAAKAIFTEAIPTLFGAGWVAVVPLGLWLLFRFRSGKAEQILIVSAVAILLHMLLTQRAPFRLYYMMPAIPGAAAATARAIVAAWRAGRRGIAVAAVALAAAGMISSSVALARQILKEPDPRSVIAEIRRQGCAVCYAEYWSAYKYRFLTNEEIHFIVFQSQDRSPDDTVRFAGLPGKRCLLEPDGAVRPFTAP